MFSTTATGLKENIQRLRARQQRLMPALEATLRAQFEQLVGYVQTQKLAGQVLNARTGKLSESIGSEVVVGGSQLRATLFSRGTAYGAAQEFGATILHPGGTAYMMTSDGIRFVTNDNALAAFLPRTKPHDIVLPERSFIRSSLSDNFTSIRAALAATAVQVLTR